VEAETMITIEERVVTIWAAPDADFDVDVLRKGLDEMLRDLGAEFADRFPGARLEAT
jgi:hypothetical protein